MNQILWRWIQALVLLFCITGNITVQAEMSQAQKKRLSMRSQLVEEPKNCLRDDQLVCGVKSQKEPKSFGWKGAQFSLAPHSVLIRVSQEEWYVSKGEVWVQANRPLNLRTRHAQILSESLLSVLVSANQDLVSVVPLEEDCVVVPSGLQTPYKVNVGLQVALEGRDRKGAGYLRLARSAALADVLKRWADLFEGSSQELAQASRQYELKWGIQADQLKQAQLELYQRQIASAEREKLLKAQRRKRYEAKKKRLREMFKRKTYY